MRLELEALAIKIELHKMLYSEDFNTLAALKRGLEELMKKDLTNDVKLGYPDIFTPRTLSENHMELEEAALELKNIYIDLKKMMERVETLNTRIEIQLYKSVGINYENKEGK